MEDSSLIFPFKLPYSEVDAQADSLVDELVGKIKHDLETIPHTLSGDDSPLENCWDDICAQRQGEEFLFWEPYEMTINGVIEGCIGELSQDDQLLLSFAALQWPNSVREPDYDCIYIEAMQQLLYNKVLELALTDTNPRVQTYLDPYSSTDDDYESRHDPDEYVLLRIDPAKRTEFLAALTLFSFVEHIDIDKTAKPVFDELLNDLDL